MKIKPLEWITYASDGSYFKGYTIGYTIGDFHEDYIIYEIGDQFYVRGELFNTLEEAKRAAQEDYERSVMSLFED